jgi:hypothetical protein
LSAATQRAEAQALATVTQVAKATRNAGAAIAQDQLRQLLLRIKVLCLLGGDPKTVARQAAQLAKEVGAAAGNLMVTAGASSTSSTSSAAASGTDNAANTGANAGTETDGAPEEAGQAEETEGVSTSASTETHQDVATPTLSPTDAAGSPATDGAGDHEVITDLTAARRTLVNQLIATGATVTTLSSAPSSAQALAMTGPSSLDQIREALSSLKGLVARTALESHDKSHALRAIRKAEKDVDMAFSTVKTGDIPEASSPTPVSVNVTA